MWVAAIEGSNACPLNPFLPPGSLQVQEGFTLLIRAAQNGQAEIAAMLLETGADKNAKTNVSHCRHAGTHHQAVIYAQVQRLGVDV